MKGGMMFDQKDIVLIHFPYTDFSVSKKRPALIISNEKENKMQDRICCLITTSPHKEDLAIEKDFFEDGKLPFKSFIKPHRIFTIHEGIIIKKLCTIKNELYAKVVEKINEVIKSSKSQKSL